MRLKSLADLPLAMRERVIPQFTPKELAALTGPKRSKYGNVKVTYDDKRFDSKLESKCYEWLLLRKQWGELTLVLRQVPFELPGGVKYRADFLAVLTTGGVEIIDAKGRDTQVSRNKRKQVKHIYGIDVRLWPVAA